MSETISRTALVEVVESALPDCAESTKAKLRRVAQTAAVVAVGWFHCDGAACPARQAGLHNGRFQEAFDRAMAARFGREIDESPHAVELLEPFVVVVEDR